MTGGLHPRLRELCSAVELALIDQGKCSWMVMRGRCGEPSDPESPFGYCTGHEHRSQALSGSDE